MMNQHLSWLWSVVISMSKIYLTFRKTLSLQTSLKITSKTKELSWFWHVIYQFHSILLSFIGVQFLFKRNWFSWNSKIFSQDWINWSLCYFCIMANTTDQDLQTKLQPNCQLSTSRWNAHTHTKKWILAVHIYIFYLLPKVSRWEGSDKFQ